MTILFHTHEFNINEGGPCTKRIDSLATYLQEQGKKVIVLASSHNKKNEKEINRKYKVIYSYSTKNTKGSNIKRFLNNIIFGITSFFKSFTVGKIDVVITTSPPPLISIFGYLIAKIKGAKLIYDIRDIWPDVAVEMDSFSEKSIYYRVFKNIANFMYRKSDIITTVTSGKVEKLTRYTNENKVKYIPNGLDDNFTKFNINNELIEKYNLKSIFTVVYIGNVGLAQNVEALVDIAIQYKENNNIQFLIFGEGASKDKINKKIQELNLKNIKVEGKIDYCNVYTILKYSKISFISLKNNKMTDSVPTKIYDALACGCPILLLAKGDSCKILDEVGLGEHVESKEELKDKFEYMYKNYIKYEDKKDDIIEYTKGKYSRRKIAEKFEREVLLKC